MKRILFLIVTLSLLLAACTPTPAAPAGKSFTDGWGRTITLPGTPARIVSLAPSNTEILFAIGAGAQVVGRDEFSDYPEEAKALPSVGGSMGDFNLETIASLQPNLVLAASTNTPEQVKALEDLGITVYTLTNPADMEGLYANITIVGELAGRQKEAADLVASLKARVQAVEEKIMILSYAPMVFYELDGSDPAKPWTVGPNTFISRLIGMAGGFNLGDSMSSEWGQFSQEELIKANPQIILLGDSNYGTTVEQVASRPGWDALIAVQQGQVFPFDDNLVSRPGPRMVDGLEALARLLHPGILD
ncbi:MAG TPA: cobalamin-binding protein [Anaerolineaceae bacterium]|nr:cobalamin-binding protein [Anaerolineaceae bacterium]HOH21446.1 cobalamin-binding protein [Anaerolineaceae bacterium]HOU45388.1 cobalamin-binding protein [Anaerolineaceae bacterium]HQF46838.1 cobalamin-binding protein [Anaerolineaceae bacterium]HQJ04648.1 cobalamin-binding protein [Anaerolineaceae bacterium]